MATPNIYASAQTEVVVGLETVRGTAASVLYSVPIMAPKYKPNIVINDDKAFRGSMNDIYAIIRGQRYDGHGWDSYPYLDSFPVFLRGLLGSPDTKTTAPSGTTLAAAASQGAASVVFAASVPAGSWFTIGSGGSLETHYAVNVNGASVQLNAGLAFAQPNGATVTGLTKHQFSLLNNAASVGNQPPSLTINDFDGEEWRQITGAQVDSVTIKGTATGLVSYTINFLGNPAVTPVAPSVSYTTVEAPPGWSSQILLGGVQVQYYTEWELDFKRNVKPVPAFTGNEGYLQYFAGPLQATGKVKVLEQSGAPELNDYLNGTVNSFDLSLFDSVTGYALNFHSTNTQFRTGEIDRSQEYVEAPLEMQLIPTTTDALAGGWSPVVATVANATTGTY